MCIRDSGDQPAARGRTRPPRARTGTRSWRATRPACSRAARAPSTTLTTAAEVDRAGAVCWEAHANEGRRPLEWRDCCESECGLFVAGPVGRDYDDAVAYCSRIGAEIATIYSATENELARQACGGSPCWIGLEEVGGDASTPKESQTCLLYTSPSPRDRQKSRMPSSA